MLMRFPTRFITHGFLLGSLLVLGGCFDEHLDNARNDAAATAAARKVQPDYTYTTDLSPWGPHPATSLKQMVTEPRFMALSHAERGKVGACSVGQHQAVHVMSMVALEEARIDSSALGVGEQRTEPVGERAKEFFYETINQGRVTRKPWPPRNLHGKEVAIMYGKHFGYQFWEQEYQAILVGQPSESVRREIYEQFWSLCLDQVPTVCFEKGPAHPELCLAHLIHPRQFPSYEEVADLYLKVMEKPNAW